MYKKQLSPPPQKKKTKSLVTRTMEEGTLWLSQYSLATANHMRPVKSNPLRLSHNPDAQGDGRLPSINNDISVIVIDQSVRLAQHKEANSMPFF